MSPLGGERSKLRAEHFKHFYYFLSVIQVYGYQSKANYYVKLKTTVVSLLFLFLEHKVIKQTTRGVIIFIIINISNPTETPKAKFFFIHLHFGKSIKKHLFLTKSSVCVDRMYKQQKLSNVCGNVDEAL